jgi:hypothetical protein
MLYRAGLEHQDWNLEQYTLFQEERAIFWEVIVSVILSKTLYMYMCPIPNGFRDRAISLYRTPYGRATCVVLIGVAKCIVVESGKFENVLYWVNCTNFVD